MSWKFQNARTQKVLGGAGFGVYGISLVGQTVQEPMNILNDLDYEGDANNTSREYRFVIYDRVSLNVRKTWSSRQIYLDPKIRFVKLMSLSRRIG